MKNKGIVKALIVIAIVFLVLIIGSILAVHFFAVGVVKDTVDEAKFAAAKSEAQNIVTDVKTACAFAFSENMLSGNGKTNICDDGVTIEEAKGMTKSQNAEILDLKVEVSDFKYGIIEVTYLKIKSMDLIIEYDGNEYKLVK